MEFLDASHAEWQDMWAGLASYPINKGDALCLNQSECWEYMGSSADHHHFRHPSHPLSGKTEYAYVERRRAAVGWA
jgi:hypothetical protein